MFCNYCGSKLTDGSKFCNMCGKQLPVVETRSLEVKENNPVLVDVVDNDPPIEYGDEYIESCLKPYRLLEASVRRKKVAGGILAGCGGGLEMIGLILTGVGCSSVLYGSKGSSTLSIVGMVLMFIALPLFIVGVILAGSRMPQLRLIAGRTKNGKMCCPKCGSKGISPVATGASVTSTSVQMTSNIALNVGSVGNVNIKWVCHECATEFYPN